MTRGAWPLYRAASQYGRRTKNVARAGITDEGEKQAGPSLWDGPAFDLL